ncbi:MAG: PAS domain-containing protein, partial [Deltaproteobacteria bacterium]|nr:PAS domain-containing protein [Deltaproteobacteria bacterium]
MRKTKSSFSTGMQTSPWIILGSTAILLIVVMVLAFQNTNRERRYMSQLLSAKGAALIRAVEAGARTGMMGMMWGGQQIQQLIEETARLPDVRYMAVIDQSGLSLAHSDLSNIGQEFDPNRKITHLGPLEHENWELVTLDNGQRIFEVHRHFRPIDSDSDDRSPHMQRMMQRHRMMAKGSDDWFSPEKRRQLLIIVGMDVTPFEEAIRSDIQTTVVLSVVMLLLGFGGFISLFWMHSYRVARQSLHDTSAFANEVVRHLPVGLIATDRSGRVTFFNSAAEQISDLDRHLIQNQKPDELLPEGLCGVQKQLDRGEIVTEREMECTFAPNKAIPVSISAARIANENGEFLGQVFIMRDLSEIRRLQDEVRRQEKMAAVGGLAAGVAHEVRNPLSSIKALATFFAGQFEDGSESHEAAKVMVQEVDRLNRAITELLEFSRPTDLKRQASDIRLLIFRSIQLVQQDAANKSVDIKVNTKEDICPAWIDPDRLTQCLLNLYLNAIQAMEDGGTLTIKCTPGAADNFNIVISDTGSGMPAEQINKIFDPYYTTKSKGTGLGLAIVQKIVEAHGGDTSVHSISDNGTTFSISIPC